MTLVEMAVVVLLLGIVLFLLDGLARTTRERAKKELAIRALRTLDDAMSSYEQRFGCPPPGRPDGAADQAITALLNYAPSRAKLDGLPAVLRRTEGRLKRLVDPWGTPFRYVTPAHDSPAMRARVAGNGGRPIFDSAGPDRQFGLAEDHPGGYDLWGEEYLLEPDNGRITRRATSVPAPKNPP